jgi:sugar phosphate isomerase/epimerase
MGSDTGGVFDGAAPPLVVSSYTLGTEGSGATPADLGPVPGEAIIAVQLCDVRPTPMDEPRAESLGYRLPPGEGYGDTLGMVRALRDRHVRPRLIGVEVISTELVSQGIDAAAQTCADGARRVLADARSAVSTS